MIAKVAENFAAIIIIAVIAAIMRKPTFFTSSVTRDFVKIHLPFSCKSNVAESHPSRFFAVHT